MNSISNCPERQNNYILLTPGPLTTSRQVKESMLRDWCTWDDEYKTLVQEIRSKLVKLSGSPDHYTAVLMQGSGTFSVESVITSALPDEGKLLVIANGSYGQRIAEIATRAKIPVSVLDFGELLPPVLSEVERMLAGDRSISHVAVVHCETTTGMLNPIEEIGLLARQFNKIYIVDAMSSFGGIPIDFEKTGVHFLVSSANKCIQGVPGFGFVIARKKEIEKLEGRSRSLSLDLHDQWQTMERENGKWRFTSPTHTVRAFSQALSELEAEGGVTARNGRYRANHQLLVRGMNDLGFECLLEAKYQSPIITSFFNPAHPGYRFNRFYQLLKEKGFVIYPGKISDHDTFRIGTIGDITTEDIRRLLISVQESIYWEERL